MSTLLSAELDTAAEGRRMRGWVERLYPICRSLTGDGVRQTLRILQEHIPLEIHEVPTGTQVFDWTVPREWNVRDAYVANARGDRVIDFRRSNLHVVGYSVPVRARMSLEALRPHLHSLPDRPEWIPYRTSYFSDEWGFCLAHADLLRLEDGDYDVRIDATLEDGALTYGELVVAGDSPGEVLIHTHVCHPSLCNDNLSGIAVAAAAARLIARTRTRYTYRFLFLPGLIGAITWLALNGEARSRIRHGLVLSNAGDTGGLTYKRSRRGDSRIDRAAGHVLRHRSTPGTVVDFSPTGYDERQYCSPGIDLPVGHLSRTPHGAYPEYHTSADDLENIGELHLADTLDALLTILDVVENDRRYRNLRPCGEPQLGRRGLYGSIGGGDPGRYQQALLWVLNLSDGRHTLLDIAERADLPFALIRDAADALLETDLLAQAGRTRPRAVRT